MDTTTTMSKEEKAAVIRDIIAHSIGTEKYYKHFLGLLYTDGVKAVAAVAGCYWLLDIIASYQQQCQKDEKLRDIQFWKLTVRGSKGVVTCDRDEGDTAITQEIPFTDFPMDEFKIWVVNGVIILPSEY